MGSRNLQYEVLVLSPNIHNAENNTTNNPTLNNNIQQPSNPPINPITFETRVQKFRYSRENLRLFWIPDGFHPILVPRRDLHVAHQQQQLQQQLRNDTLSPSLQPSSNNPTSDRKQRRRGKVFGGSLVERVRRPVSPLDLYYRQKRKESANGDLSSEMVIDMWGNETEEVKRKYNRQAVRYQIELTLKNNPRISPRRVPLRSHSNLARPNILEPIACYDSQHQSSVKQQASDLNAAISYAFGNNHGGNNATFNSANGSLTQGRDMKENYNSGFYQTATHDDISSPEVSEEDSDDANTHTPIPSPGLSATQLNIDDEDMAANDAEFSL